MQIKKYLHWQYVLLVLLASCVDNELDVYPNDQNFPLQLVLDGDEGADLPDAEDYDVEVAFADHVGDLPNEPLTLLYAIEDLEGDMEGSVEIDKVIYEYEDDDCVFERELDFTINGDGTSGSITLDVDKDLGTVPDAFEIVFALPGNDDTEGSFTFTLSELTGSEGVILGAPVTFKYEVLDSDIAGEWQLQLASEDTFEEFKDVFGPLNPALNDLTFSDITGEVTAEFAFGEMKFIIELAEEEELVTCENGETEATMEHLVIEVEADYDTDDGDLTLEGSHYVLGDDGEIENELDYEIEAAHQVASDELSITFLKVVDEDNFAENDELYASDEGSTFIFKKD